MKSTVFVLAEGEKQRNEVVSVLRTPNVKTVPLIDENDLASYLTQCKNSTCLILGQEIGEERKGLDVLRSLKDYGSQLPCIFICAQPSIHLVVAAYRAGVVEFIRMPEESSLIVPSVMRAFELQHRWMEREDAKRRLGSLSADEFHIISMMLEGATNRRIASRMEIGVRSVERARSRILRKIGAHSLFEVARLYGIAFKAKTESEPKPRKSVLGSTGVSNSAAAEKNDHSVIS